MRIPFSFTGSAARLTTPRTRGIYRVYFCGRNSRETAHLLLFLSLFLFSVYRSEPVIVIACPTSRTTVLRNAENWRGKRGRKNLGLGGDWRFMTTRFTIFLLHVDPADIAIPRDREIGRDIDAWKVIAKMQET